ncbi:GGDEF domain-containing protein [Ectobacillus panaciterrae]|uniref:GGDEF domain-containing protein n=1 Tax=Ectobacillus panaciterrae TaxID=363872 RepID=UPI00042030C1|nr:diguanylate cyclase [Ectobacillus panaciterrae]
MVRELFVNLTILLSFIFVGGQVARNQPLHQSVSYKGKLMLGIVCGILGVILIQFGLHLEHVFLDLRHLAIILAAIYGGPVACIITALIIGTMRLVLVGFSDSAVLGATIALMGGLGCAVISYFFSHLKKRWFWLNVYCLLLVLAVLIRTGSDFSISAVYLLICIAAGYITFISASYAYQSNELYRNMERNAKIDFLTGLQNVRQFDDMLNHYVVKSKEHREALSLMLIDIDYFKKVNDTYGHPAGDAVLRQVGKILQDKAPSPNLAFRKGGEEFAILLPSFTLTEAVDLGERIREEIENYTFLLPEKGTLTLTVSVGASVYKFTPHEFIEAADTALYYSKQHGRNQVNAI